MAKLNNVNAHYLRSADADRLADLVCAGFGTDVDANAKARVSAAMPILTPRAKTLGELADAASFLVARPSNLTPKAAKILDPAARELLGQLLSSLETCEIWDEEALEAAVRAFAEAADVKLGAVAQPLRAALTGSHASPGIFEVMALLGREESLARIAAPPLGAP